MKSYQTVNLAILALVHWKNFANGRAISSRQIRNFSEISEDDANLSLSPRRIRLENGRGNENNQDNWDAFQMDTQNAVEAAIGAAKDLSVDDLDEIIISILDNDDDNNSTMLDNYLDELIGSEMKKMIEEIVEKLMKF